MAILHRWQPIGWALRIDAGKPVGPAVGMPRSGLQRRQCTLGYQRHLIGWQSAAARKKG
jgi:hypothetical protein